MKTEKNRKLHGSVLLTVVAVMAMLIIFMTGTLVLANAANRRSHRSYTSSQAEYTARAAIDAFYRSTQDNTAIRDAVLNLGTSVEYAPIDFGPDYNPAMGRLVDPDGTGTNDGTIRIEQLHDFGGNAITEWRWNASTADSVGNPITPGWEEFNVYRATATVQVGQRGARKTVYQDFLGNPRVFTRTTPRHRSHVPEGLRTVGAAMFPDTDGSLATPVIVGLTNCDRTENYQPSNSIRSYSETFFVNGNYHTYAQMYMHVQAPSFQTIITGDFTCENEIKVDIEYDESLLPSGFTQQDVPYFFVNGQFKYTAPNQAYMGSSGSNPYNMFFGNIDTSTGGDFYFGGDVYLMDDSGTSTMGGSGSHLYKWADGMTTAGSQFYSGGGNIYCNHDLTINGTFDTEGDVRVKGTLTVNLERDGFKCGGNVVCDQLVINFVNGSGNFSIGPGSAIFTNGVSGDEARIAGLARDTYDAFGEPAYPTNMTREMIYGTEGSDYGHFEPAGDTTKIIQNQKELLDSMGYDWDTETFPTDTYYTELPVGVALQNSENTCNLGTFEGTRGTWTNGSPSHVVYLPSDGNYTNGTLNIIPNADEFWVVIGEEGATTTLGNDFNLVIDDASHIVNVMIRGTVVLNDRSAILSKYFYDKFITNNDRSIDQRTDFINLSVYSYRGATLKYANQGFITANCLAPEMTLTGGNQGWNGFTYVNKWGLEVPTTTVHWVGNGLFDRLDESFDNFTFLQVSPTPEEEEEG